MDPFDREKTQRVWQRVLARQTPEKTEPEEEPGADLELLARELQRSAGLYLNLARQAGGAAGHRLEELAASAREDAAFLRGLYRYETGRAGETTAQGLSAPGNLGPGLRLAIAREQALAAALAGVGEAREMLLRSSARRRRRLLILLGGGNYFHF